jgi:hypothetical protein
MGLNVCSYGADRNTENEDLVSAALSYRVHERQNTAKDRGPVEPEDPGGECDFNFVEMFRSCATRP